MVELSNSFQQMEDWAVGERFTGSLRRWTGFQFKDAERGGKIINFFWGLAEEKKSLIRKAVKAGKEVYATEKEKLAKS